MCPTRMSGADPLGKVEAAPASGWTTAAGLLCVQTCGLAPRALREQDQPQPLGWQEDPGG